MSIWKNKRNRVLLQWNYHSISGRLFQWPLNEWRERESVCVLNNGTAESKCWAFSSNNWNVNVIYAPIKGHYIVNWSLQLLNTFIYHALSRRVSYHRLKRDTNIQFPVTWTGKYTSVVSQYTHPREGNKVDTKVVRFEVFMTVTMKNVVFWDIKSQFVPHR
jgi:hypothetical protein